MCLPKALNTTECIGLFFKQPHKHKKYGSVYPSYLFFLSSFQDLIINKWIINKSWLFRHSTSKQGLHDAFDGWCLLQAPQGMYLSHSSSVWRDVYRLLNIQVELRVKLRNIKLSSKTFCEGILLERTWVVFNSYGYEPNRNWLSREFNSCDQNLHRRQNKLKCFIFNTNANSGMLSTQLCYTVTCPQCFFGIAVDWDYCWLGVTYSTPTKWESDLGRNIMFSTITVSQRWMESGIWWSQVEGEWIKTKLITGFR